MTAIPLFVTAVGLACPLGLRAEPACAAIRAGIKRFQQSRYKDDAGEPIVCSELSLLPAHLLHRERALQLLELAVLDTVRGSDPAELPHLPLLVGTAEVNRPGGVSEVLPDALTRLHREHGLRLDAARSRCFPTGNTASLRALAYARTLLEQQPWTPGCLVAGVDSLVNAPALWWLDQHERLRRMGFSDGVIPGEAAACVLVTRRPRPGAPRLLVVQGLGFAREAATLQSDEPLRGRGLTQAAQAALSEAHLHMSDMDFRMSDASGEGYSFKELSLVLAKLLRVRKESLPLWLRAESLGEIGAASGSAALVMAALAMSHGHAPGPRALLHTASHEGDRATAVLAATEPKL